MKAGNSGGVKKTPYRKSSAVKKLEALANEAALKKFPEIPSEYLAPRKYRDDTANTLTKCIIHFIRLTGGQAERISNTGRQITRKMQFVDVVGFQKSIICKHWIPGTGTNGTADISATIQGRSIKIEVKVGVDRQSKAQKQYQEVIEQAGGVYFIARTFADFYEWFQVNYGGISDAK